MNPIIGIFVNLFLFVSSIGVIAYESTLNDPNHPKWHMVIWGGLALLNLALMMLKIIKNYPNK